MGHILLSGSVSHEVMNNYASGDAVYFHNSTKHCAM